LDACVLSLGHGGLRLENWLQYDYRKKQSDECEDRLCVEINAHGSGSLVPQISGSSQRLDASSTKSFETGSGLAVEVNPRSFSNRRAALGDARHVEVPDHRVLIPNGR
jgi:hypothetical protein